MKTTKIKNYLSGSELNANEIDNLLHLAVHLKRDPARYSQAMRGTSIVGLFEKPSLRTRLSFEIGLARLGAQTVYLDHQNERIGVRESIKDYARNLSMCSQGLFVRVYQHDTLSALSAHADIPVVNALCERYHPCQALADVLTVHEQFGAVKGVRIAYLGDGNNVAASLCLAAAKLGAHMVCVTPPTRTLPADVLAHIHADAGRSGGSFTVLHDVNELGACDVVYTDTWISMGSALSEQSARDLFARYQVNAGLMQQTNAAMFLHCQPAHRNCEVTDEVFDGPQSQVLRQAENRMHAQNALWLVLLNKI